MRVICGRHQFNACLSRQWQPTRTHLVDEIHGTSQEASNGKCHQRLDLLCRSPAGQEKNDDGCGQRSDGHSILPVVAVGDEDEEGHGKGDAKKEVEFEKDDKDLISKIPPSGLDVCANHLIGLPRKCLSAYAPGAGI